MKIGEALTELKKEKAGLRRLIELRKETFWVEKKAKPVISTQELTQQINEKMKSIRLKKARIQKSNLECRLEEESLAEAILRIADLRSEISALSELKEGSRRFSLREENEHKTPQLNPLQIERMAEKLEKEKSRLDSLLQSFNWKQEI